jgi:excisionase family DNA binding protein
MQLLCLRMVETAGVTLVLGRNVMPALLIARARSRRTKVPERAASSTTASPGSLRKRKENEGSTRKSLLLRKRAEGGSFAAVTAAMAEAEPDLRSVREAADYLGVSSRSIYNWIKDGRLTEYWTLGHGERRVDFNELRRLVKE